jgi:hypothetical protein
MLTILLNNLESETERSCQHLDVFVRELILTYVILLSSLKTIPK